MGGVRELCSGRRIWDGEYGMEVVKDGLHNALSNGLTDARAKMRHVVQ